MVKIKAVRRKSPSGVERPEITEAPREADPKSPNSPKSPRSSGYLLWFVASGSIIFLFFSLSYFFSSAQITISPRTEEAAINQSLTASKSSSSSPMPFDLIVIEGVEEKKVEAGERKAVKYPARGLAIIYNDFSESPQLLSVDTRLEGSNGKIYKTEKRVLVPGRKDGKPGALEVGIYAASPGPAYNSAPLDFKIFGFKGTPRYEKIYARSKGNLTGGAEGNLYVIPQSQKAQVLADLQNSLKEKLLSKATEQIPKGFVLFKNAAFLSANDSEVSASGAENPIPLRLKGTLYGFLLDEKKLTKKIAADAVARYDQSEVFIPNLQDLSFSLLSGGDAPWSDMKTIDFTLRGTVKIVWKFDADKFRLELRGRKKKDFNLVLAKYPNVTSASLMLKPFWRLSLPSKPERIKVLVNYPPHL